MKRKRGTTGWNRFLFAAAVAAFASVLAAARADAGVKWLVEENLAALTANYDRASSEADFSDLSYDDMDAGEPEISGFGKWKIIHGDADNFKPIPGEGLEIRGKNCVAGVGLADIPSSELLKHADKAIVEVEWKLLEHPRGACYAKGGTDEAVAVLLAFGDKVKSGKFFLPKVPRSLELFWGPKDKKGAVFATNGWFPQVVAVCVENSRATGRWITTRIYPYKYFVEIFTTQVVEEDYRTKRLLPITGVGLLLDTNTTKKKGKAVVRRFRMGIEQ